ncbi:MAG TPA: hypothetical protein VLM40_03475 [Gemmata sp.]|nr:hypothetical protein [Gemmata sp.]
MRGRLTPPVMPADLLGRTGAPEDVFGPNRRFRTASTLLGGGLMLLGIGLSLVWAAGIANGGPPGSSLYLLLGGGLIGIGAVAVVLPRQVPTTWVFICPRGLVRVRGADWEAVEWAEVVRVEDASLPAGETIRQCRVLLVGGREWGFLAEYVADCGRLIEVLRRKMAELGLPELGTAEPLVCSQSEKNSPAGRLGEDAE